MKKQILLLLWVIIGCLFIQNVTAQNASGGCAVIVRQYDSYGDGWNGNTLHFYQGDSLVESISMDGGAIAETTVMLWNDSVRLEWSQGSWSEECSFTIEDSEGEVLYTSPIGMSGIVGEFAKYLNSCPRCPRPTGLHLLSQTASRLVVGWTGDTATDWLVEYGPYGFERGTGVVQSTTNDTLAMEGLEANSSYQVYVAMLCGEDTSGWTTGAFVTSCEEEMCSYTIRLTDNYYNTFGGGRVLICHESGAVLDTVTYPYDGNYYSYYDKSFSVCPGNVKLKYETVGSNYTYALQYRYMTVFDAEGDTVSSFRAYDVYGSEGYYDSIQYYCPSCMAVQSLSSTTIDSSSAFISWTDTTAGQYLVTYSPMSGDGEFGTVIVEDATSVILTGLQPSTTYQVQVQAICGQNDTSKMRTAMFTTGPRWCSKVYVSQNANADIPDGLSWATAVSTIYEAQQIAAAQAVYNNYPDIWVAAGTYYGENTVYPRQHVYGGFVGDESADYDLSQRDFSANATILDGYSYNYRVLNQNDDFTNGTAAVWDGFTIQHGYQGAYLRSWSTLRNCLIKENRGYEEGTGVFINNSGQRYVAIDRCKITNNVAYNNGYYGGGIYAGNVIIDNTLIAGNQADWAGGIYAYNVTLRHCDIVENRAFSGPGGYLDGVDTMVNCIIWNNRYGTTDSIPIQMNVSYNNGLVYESSASVDMLAGNGNIILSTSNWGHESGVNYVGFVAPVDGNYSLNAGSACVNAGVVIAGFQDIDLAGGGRTIGTAPDMGCYENDGSVVCNAPYGLTAGSRSGIQAQLRWESSSGESYNLQYAPLDSNGWMTVSGILDNGYTLNGLQEYTIYKARVGVSCTGGVASDYSDSILFNSGCANPVENISITGNGNTNGVVPIRRDYMFSESLFMVTGDELEHMPRIIDTVGFRYNSSECTRNIIVKIYETADDNISWSNVNESDEVGQTVFSGTVRFRSDGWTFIPLHFPYYYEGTNNIVMRVTDNTGSTDGNNGYFFYNTPGLTTLYTYGISSNDNYGFYTTDCRPDLYLSGGCDLSSCHTPRLMVSGVTDTSVTLVCSRMEGVQQVAIRPMGSDIFTITDNISWNDSLISVSGLTSNQYYEIRMRNICDADDSSGWYAVDFRTNPQNYSRIYVKADANGNGNGTSWDDAFVDLNEALSVASISHGIYGSYPVVWVAAGTYYGDNSTTGNSAFTLVDGVSIYGGFAGNEPEDYDISQRNISANPTVLDGQGQRRVVYQGSDFYNHTILNGLTITNGYLNSGQGAGLCLRGNVRLENSTVSNNTSSSNWNSVYGIGIYAYTDNAETPVIIDHCTVKNNGNQTNSYQYGVVYMCNAVIDHSVISENQIFYYTIYSYNGNNQINNSLICNNTNQYGSGIYNNYSYLTLNNTDVVSNTIFDGSDIIYTYYSNRLTLNNTVVWGNMSGENHCYFNNYSNCILHNCAFDGLTEAIPMVMTLSDSNEGTAEGANYPRFASPDEFDFTIVTGSALIDAGDSTYATSAIDLTGNPRVSFEQVDIGCYENNAVENCPRVIHITISSVGSNSAYITYQYGGDEAPNGYEIELSTPDSGWYSYGTTTQNHLFLTNLDTNQQYYVRVRSVCGEDYGQYSRVGVFHTHPVGICVPLIVGTSEDTDGGWCLPTNTCYYQSFTQQLYLAEEMGADFRRIDSMGFQYVYPYADTRVLDIYLAHTSQGSLTSIATPANYELVFSGSVYFDNSRENYWCNIPLQTSFEYNGADNLLVTIIDHTGSVNYCDNGLFRTHYTNGTMARYGYRNNSSAYSINSLPSGSGGNYRANIRFGGNCQSYNNACLEPNMVVSNVTSNSAEVEWVASGQYEFQMRAANSEFIDATILQSPCQINSLKQNTTYTLRMRNICGNDTSAWREVHFTTKPSESSVVYVKTEAMGLADGSSWDNATSDVAFAQSVAIARAAVYGEAADVWVAHGVYHGDTTSFNAFTVVEGVDLLGGFSGVGTERNPQLYPTVLDGGNQRRVVYQPSRFNTRTTWSGITVTGGNYSDPYNCEGYGHGLYLRGGFTLKDAVVTQNCVVSSNLCTQYGGGIYTTDANYDNPVIVDHCDISYNGYQANSSFYNGAAVYGNTYTTIRDSRMHHNAAGYGTLYAGSDNMYVIGSLVDNNKSLYSGAAAYVGNGYLYMYNSTIVDNYVDNNTSSSYTGGIYSSSDYRLNLYNTVLWRNRGTGSSNGNLSGSYSAGNLHSIAIEGVVMDSVLTLSSGNFGDDTAANYPAFVNPDDGDYRLHPSSSLVNQGGNVWVVDTLDFGGQARVYDEIVDLGAFEYHGEEYCLSPAGLSVSNVTENSAWISFASRDGGIPYAYETYLSVDGDNWTLYSSGSLTGFFLSNLYPSTQYKVRVRTLCDNEGDASPYANTTFSTTAVLSECDPIIVTDNLQTTTGGNYLPTQIWYNYSYTQQLFTAEELGGAQRSIDTVRFQYFCPEPYSRNIVLYMAHTNVGSLESGYLPGSSLQQVYSGTVNFNNLGPDYWVSIILDTPFEYNGADNLVVAMVDNSGWYQNSSAKFYTHATPNAMSVYKYNDNGAYDIFNPPSGTVYNYRSNIWLGGECEYTSNACGRPNLVVDSISDHHVHVSLLAGSNYELQLRLVGEADYSTVVLSADSTINGLKQNSSYQLRVRNICGFDTSGWRTVMFSTIPSQSPVVYVAQQSVGLADGSSWDNATDDINLAMDYAVARGIHYGTPADVWVASGIYYGDVSSSTNAFTMRPGVNVYGGFVGNEVSLDQRNASDNTTILDGGNQRRVLYQEAGFTSDKAVVWDGFTIQHGYSQQGAGVYMRSFSTLRNCRVIDNNASGHSGGGIYVYANNIGDYYDSLGSYRYRATSIVENCLVSNNRAYHGGGIYLASGCDIVGCLVSNNTASSYGGGIYVDNSNYAVLSSSIVANSAGNYGGIGGSPLVYNSVVWGNASTNNDNAYQIDNASRAHFSAIGGNYNSGMLDSTCIILSQQNMGSYNSPHFSAPTTGVGYQYAGGDWTLVEGSPMSNRGLNSLVASSIDLTNGERIQNDTTDMGAYESPFGGVELPVYNGVVYVVDGGTGLMDGTSWQNATPYLQDAINIASQHSLQVWVAEGTYIGDGESNNAFIVRSGADLYGGFAGIEESILQRDPDLHPTIIDGQLLQRVLYIPSLSTMTTWDGIIIQNGYTNNSGGGIYSMGGNFTLRNSIVRNNTSFGSGGGICRESNNSNRFLVDRCILSGNIVSGSGNGGGIYVGGYTSIMNTTINDNHAGYGAGVYISYSDNYCYNTVIHHNEASSYGGAAYLSGNVTFEGCDLVQNTCSYGTGGVHSYYSNYGIFNNCIIWGNKTGYYVDNLSGSPILNHSAVEALDESQYLNSVNLAPANDGTDPSAYYVRFMDPSNGDYRLHPSSSVIDAGDSTLTTQTADFDSNPRVFGNNVDIGAFESSVQNDCPSVTGLNVSDVTASSASLSWNSTDGNGYFVQWTIEGAEQYDTLTTTDTTVVLSGLVFNRNYIARVRTLCNDGTASFYSISVGFTTTCESETLDTLSDFASFSPADNSIVYNNTVSFSWTSLPEATSYDFYLWPATGSQPSSPSVRGLLLPQLQGYLLPGYTNGVQYHWKVVAWNECINKESQVMTLRVNDFPDLHVSAIVNSSPVANQQMTVTWTVTNDGPGNTPPGVGWNDYIWITGVDGIGGGFWYDVDEVLLATVGNLSSLQSGESYTNSATVTIPPDYIGGYYIFVLTDQYSARDLNYNEYGLTSAPIPYTPSVTGDPYPYFSGTDHGYVHTVTEVSGKERDNFFYKVINILPPPTPDLAVSHISHPTNTFSGSQLTVQWSIRNQGDAAAMGQWRDAIYIQPGTGDSLTSSARRLATVARPGTEALIPNAEYQSQATVEIPIDYLGSYTIFVTADYDNNLYESIFEGNNTAASDQALNVTLTPPADLEVTAINAPAVVSPSQRVTVAYTVHNAGASPTHSPSWFDAVYLSSSQTLNTDSAILLSSQYHHGVLNADSTYSTAVTITIPDHISGEWNLFVVTDRNNDVFEYTFEDNNTMCLHPPLQVVVPDLLPHSLSVSDTAVSPGQTITVSYTVHNQGLGIAANTWNDAVYLTHSDVFSSQARMVHSVRHAEVLPSDSSYHVTVSFDLPRDITGSYTLWLNTDYNDRVYEGDSDNNNLIPATELLQTTLPNLIVTDICVSDTLNLADSTFAIRYTTRNSGPGAMLNRSYTETVRVAGQQLWHASLTNITLAPGDSLVRNATVALHCQNSVQLALTVTTDANNEVSEASETDNQSQPSFAPVLIAPDFAVQVGPVDDTLWSGKTADFQWVVTNNGQAAVTGRRLTDRAYFTTSATSHSESSLVDEYTRVVTLAPGGSDTVLRSITLPDGISGQYHLHVVTNADNTLCEGVNNLGNTTVSGAIPVLLSPYADLMVDNVTTPAEVNIGEFVTITYTITNNGEGALENASFSNKFYYSPSASVYNTRNLLATQAISLDLEVGESVQQQVSFVVPTTLSAGNWYVWAVLDADNEVYEHTGENNNTAHSSQMRVKQYNLDLAAQQLQGPTSVEWGQRATYVLTVKNNSELPTLAPLWVDKIFLSNDGVLNGSEQQLFQAEHRTMLEADSNYKLEFAVTIPMGTPASSYLVAVVDNERVNPDIELDNNVIVLPLAVSSVPTPDLSVSQFELLADTIVSGQTAQAVYTVSNISEVAVELSSWTDKIYLSTNASNGLVIELGSYAHQNAGLAPGESYTDTVDFTVPLPNQGHFNIIMKANAALGFYEVNTGNNSAQTSTVVLLPPPGDLVVQDIDITDSVQSGRSVTATWDVTNIGVNTLTGSGLRSLVYLSADTVFDAGDKLLGDTETGHISLAYNQKVQQSLTARVSGVPEGKYYVIVKTNVRNSFNEVDCTNNTSASPLPVVVTIRPLQWDTPTIDTLFNNIASDFKLDVGDYRGETALVTLKSNDSLLGAVNMIFISHNNVGDNMNYTYSTIGQYTANPELYIPSTLPGYYGINLYGSTPSSGSQQVTITASVIPFELRQVNPSVGGNSGKVTLELIGSRFRPDMDVYLIRGNDTLMADSLIYGGYYRSFATFDLKGADTGFYNVSVVNFCEGEAFMSDAFKVVPGTAEGLQHNLVFPNSPRPNRNIVMMLEFGNTGFNDITGAVLELESMGGAWISLTPEGITEHKTKLQIPLTIEGEPEGLLRPGTYGTINVYGYTSGALMFTIERIR